MTEQDVPIVADLIRRAIDAALVHERTTHELALRTALGPICERVAAIEARPPTPGPPGERGAPGAPGAPGKDGQDGKPGMQYHGVFVPGKTYEKGDCVTYDGSVWHCDADMTPARPGNGVADWTLAVKRGQNGRDGKDGRP
jgi:hypothetical protein